MNQYMKANVVFSRFSRDYMGLKRDLPIRPSEMGVLNIVSHREGDFMPLMLAEMIGVSKPMITAHIQVLLKKGYIRKETSGLDRRSFFVRPTEAGKALADTFEARQIAYLKAIEAELGEADFDVLVRLLTKAQTILDTIQEAEPCKTMKSARPFHVSISIENQEMADKRLAHFLDAPLAHREVFCSSLIAPSSLGKYLDTGLIKCVNVGGEMSPKNEVRPLRWEWVRDLFLEANARNIEFYFQRKMPSVPFMRAE